MVQRVLTQAPQRRAAVRRPRYARRHENGRRAPVLRRGALLTETTDAALAALMCAAQNGDARAYQALLGQCVPVAASAARRQGVPPDRIEDVVQDVLLTVHRARATYDPARPFLPWLRAIAQRRAIDALRRRYKHAPEIQDEDAAAATPADQPEALDLLTQAERAGMLAAAVAALPPGQRQAVELLALQERSLEEASGQTGRTKLALKVNLHRAIQALRKRLTEADDV